MNSAHGTHFTSLDLNVYENAKFSRQLGIEDFTFFGIYCGIQSELPIEIGPYKMNRAYGTHFMSQCLNL